MKERLLFVAAGIAQTSGIREARERGYYIVAMDSAPDAPGFLEADEEFVADITRPEEIIRVYNSSHADALVCISCDAALLAVAIACKKLGLPGISVDAARISQSKLLQRQALSLVGMHVPKYQSVVDVGGALKAWDDFKVEACVIKPVDASGSRGVSFVGDRSAVAAAFSFAHQNSRSGVVLIESFMPGIEYSVEAWVVELEPQIIAISEKVRSKPPYLLDKEVHFPANLSPNKKELVIKYATDAIRACGLRDCPVHVEVVDGANGPVLIELAARGAGFKVFTEILPSITGKSMVQASIDTALGKQPDLKRKASELTAASLVFISPVDGVLKSVRGLEAASALSGVEEVVLYTKLGQRMNPLRSGSDRAGHVIVYNKDPAICRSTAHEAIKLIQLDVEL